ncbi:MAG: dienelactone hydrolase family protein [Microcystaceae cyanobacterium]
MTNQPIKSQTVTIPNEDVIIDAYLATPETEGEWPAIIVIQEIFGVNDHIKDVTQRIAEQGYVAIAPAIYQRQIKGFETGYTDKDIEIGRDYKNKTKASELLSDIQATINYLYQLPQVKAEGVGTIGFCFGGHVTYLVATLPDIKATASFYGAQIPTWCPGEEQPTITRTPEIKGTLYGFFGTADPLIPLDHVDAVETALKGANIPHQIFRYEGADHGFFCDQRASYNQAAATNAWQQVLSLYEKTLG